MLDKKSKKILKLLNKIKDDNNAVDGSKALLKHLPKKYTEDYINNILRNLANHEYIQCFYGDGTIIDIDVMYKGQIYKEVTRNEVKTFLLKSVLTPIIIACIVAILTTLITLKINSIKNQSKDNTYYNTNCYWCYNY